MNGIILAIASLAAISAPGPQRPNAPVMVDAIRADCPLTVRFASYAMGIDSRAYEEIVRTLQYDRAVWGIEQHNWGREGERTLCVDVRTSSEVRRVVKRVRALIPRHPRGPVMIGTRTGQRVTVKGAKR